MCKQNLRGKNRECTGRLVCGREVRREGEIDNNTIETTECDRVIDREQEYISICLCNFSPPTSLKWQGNENGEKRKKNTYW